MSLLGPSFCTVSETLGFKLSLAYLDSCENTKTCFPLRIANSKKSFYYFTDSRGMFLIDVLVNDVGLALG